MKLSEYQEKAFEFNLVSIGDQRTHSLCGLIEEVGELSGKIKRMCRGDYRTIMKQMQFDDDLKKELGDILWYVSDFCSTHGFSLEEIAKENIEKLEDRRARGVIKGSGDER